MIFVVYFYFEIAVCIFFFFLKTFQIKSIIGQS